MTTVPDLLEMLDTHLARYPVMALQDMYKLLHEAIYPAVHHTRWYREAYRPAYRLISDAARDLIQKATR